MDRIIKLLTFCRVVDAHDGLVSLTNVALITCVTKLAVAPQASVADIGGLLLALLAYTGKKVLRGQSEAANSAEVTTAVDAARAELTAQVEQLRSEIGKVQMATSFKR